MDNRSTIDQRFSRASNLERDIPSFIEPRPPLILNPFMRPRPQKGTNLLELFEEDSIEEELPPELVQVYLRLKPSNVQSNLYEVRSDQCLVTSMDTATAGHGRRTQHNVSKMYKFSHIFGPESNQKEIFEHVVKDNLRKLPDGHNFTLLTYGASGSGKTYTLMGTVKAPGLVPRSLEYVFKVVDAAQNPLYHPGESRAVKLSLAEQEHELQWVKHLRHVSAPLRDKYRRMSVRLCSDMSKSTLDLSNRTKHYVWVSFVEIYNEAIYDLLVTTERNAASKLRIREDPSGNAYVKGATQAFVRSGEEAYDVLVAGKHNLQVHATGVHAQSSRSHCIFTITMLTETESGVRHSYVRLCDLAGSERARRTRNTGARMAESRAINTSLHVLERCLHTLRRKQARATDMVPYRESKLTRLLGAGLSGARGEAVSMVVTLHPAPEYAHESRHVLQLAAVARDIQVNNTIAESISTLESSCSQDTTIAATSSTEVTRLRADNERLHYELVQAEALNAKLMADIADKREENALTVRELVDEARDITEQFYKTQLRSLEDRHRAEITELREEYEAMLSKKSISRESETPTRSLQNKIIALMQQIAILEEELSAERLARARMDDEMQHLRACIEERDEKSSDENSNNEDAIQLTDSEDDSDETDDLCNESLEPTFKKDDINRSRLTRSITHTHNTTHDNTYNTTNENMNKTSDTAKDDSLTDKYDGNEESTSDSTVVDESEYEKTDETYDVSNADSCNDQSIDCPATVKKANAKNDSKSSEIGRGTYFVNSMDESKHSAETYFVSDSKISVNEDESKGESLNKNDASDSEDMGINVSLKDDNQTGDFKSINKKLENSIKPVEPQIGKIKNSVVTSVLSNSSLTQFELLEREANDFEKKDKQARKYFDNGELCLEIQRKVREKKPYFDDVKQSSQVESVTDLLKKHDALRSPSIVQDDIPENYKPSTINKLIRESFTKIPDIPPFKKKEFTTRHDSMDIFEESPLQNNVLQSVEHARKCKDKIALDIKREETNTSLTDEIIEKEVCDEMEKDSLELEEVKSCADNLIDPNQLLNHITSTCKDVDSKVLDVLDRGNEDLSMPLKLNIKEEITNPTEDTDAVLPIGKEDQLTVPKLNVTAEISPHTEKYNEVKAGLDIKREIYDEHELSSTEITKKIKNEQERSSSEIVETKYQNVIQTEELPNVTSEFNASANVDQTSQDTIHAFEDIYKDLSVPRATEFELLVSEKTHETVNEPTNVEELAENQTNKTNETDNIEKAIKYNLRNKTKAELEAEVLAENTAKNATKTVKKSLRLRRQKKIDETLQDIVNLQKEFSDVTLDVPAPVKEIKDIPSPDQSESENLPPLMGVQSCPSKSVTRSRRKLFTPRAEPLEESPGAGTSGEAGGRVRVPRPSYHRPRTRRRLN